MQEKLMVYFDRNSNRKSKHFMAAEQNPKQQVAQRIKDANNILVTVSRDPSVDELASALAMSLMLDKLNKSSTAVFSGKIPSAIDFLEPGKTFDTNVDGLRDFIIALDKSKADRLRYKVEGDVVRVFITPYRTTISQDDLEFSQGDFNVELVLAFGVEKNDDLDAAIAAHGRILHDAAVVTVNAGSSGSLGEINWSDESASSLSEMLVGLMESLQADLLDEPIASALLTGLVSATDRFRNEKTSPKVMTMSAQLMAAGANQQLIADNLENSVAVDLDQEETTEKNDQAVDSNAGEMKIERDEDEASSETTEANVGDRLEETTSSIVAERSADAIAAVHKELEQVAPQSDEPQLSEAKASSWRDAPMPSTGGTLNATTEQAAEAAREAQDQDKNRVLLSHDNEPVISTDQPSVAPALNSTNLDQGEPPAVDIFAAPAQATAAMGGYQFTGPSASVDAEPNPVLDDLKQQSEVLNTPGVAPEISMAQPVDVPAQLPETSDVDSARAAVDALLGDAPATPSDSAPISPADPGSLAPAYAVPSSAPAAEPAVASAVPVNASLPPLPPMPDFSTLPPLPGEGSAAPAPIAQEPIPSFGLPTEENNSSPFPITAPPSSDPSQFQLPGQ